MGLDSSYRASVSEVGILSGTSNGIDVEFPMGLTPNEALGLVQAEREHVRLHEAMLAGSVAAARCAGCSWEVIGQILGLTKQAVHQRYSALLLEASDEVD